MALGSGKDAAAAMAQRQWQEAALTILILASTVTLSWCCLTPCAAFTSALQESGGVRLGCSCIRQAGQQVAARAAQRHGCSTRQHTPHTHACTHRRGSDMAAGLKTRLLAPRNGRYTTAACAFCSVATPATVRFVPGRVSSYLQRRACRHVLIGDLQESRPEAAAAARGDRRKQWAGSTAEVEQAGSTHQPRSRAFIACISSISAAASGSSRWSECSGATCVVD